MSRYRRMRKSPIAWPRRPAWLRRQSRWTPALALVALALAGCSMFGGGQPEKPIDPNVFPADYKAGLMTFLQVNPFGLVGTREAALSQPELKAFGNESRYVACLRVVGPDLRKDKMIVYFAGAINQFVDAGERCNGAAYQPFPELPTLFAQLRSKT